MGSKNLAITLDLNPIIQDMIAKYGYPVAGAFIFGFFIATLIAIYYFRNPERLQKLIANIFALLIKLGFKIQKTYIKLDIEGRVNDFIKNLQPLVYGYEPIGVRIKWVELQEVEDSFFNDSNLILVMRDSGLQNRNFVRATMTVVSKTVLPKIRRYLSKSQAESVDLYIGKRLFEKEKPQVMDYFFEEFFDKRTSGNDNIADLVEKYHIMDRAGLFFPVFVQELNFLGEKVFYQRKTEEITKDVNALVEFLKNYAGREVGTTTTPLVYQGKYCRCGIVIIGRIENVASGRGQIYANYVSRLLNQKIENFYFISPNKSENIEFVDTVINSLSDVQEYRRTSYESLINVDGQFKPAETHLIVLRNQNIVRYYDASYQRGYIENAQSVSLEENSGEPAKRTK